MVLLFSFVVIGIDAMDQLLVTCHSLNLFVYSFLKVVQLILESQHPSLQILATNSVSYFWTIIMFMNNLLCFAVCEICSHRGRNPFLSSPI